MVRPRTLLVIPFSRIDGCGGCWTIAVLKRIVRCQIAFRSDAGRMGVCFLWADSMAWGRRRCLSIMDSARSSLLTILVGKRWRMISIGVTPPARVPSSTEAKNRLAIVLHAGSTIGHATRSVDATSALCSAIWHRRSRAPHGLAEDRQVIKSQGTHPHLSAASVQSDQGRACAPRQTRWQELQPVRGDRCRRET